jgi:hypothetical protein
MRKLTLVGAMCCFDGSRLVGGLDHSTVGCWILVTGDPFAMASNHKP